MGVSSCLSVQPVQLTMSSDWIILAAAFVSLISLIALLQWIYRKTSPFHTAVNRIPGPIPLPIVGNSFDLLGGFDHILETMQIKWPEKYGEIYRVFIGSTCHICITSPELLEKILTSNSILEKGVDYNYLRYLLGDGLILSTGDKWKQRRRLITPAFHFQILENFLPFFNQQSAILCDQIENRMVEAKTEMDLFPLFIRCTLDIICGAAMGTIVNAQTQDTEYLHASIRNLEIMVERMQKPWLSSDFFFSLTPLGREQNSLLKITNGFVDNVISQRRQYLNEMKLSGKPLKYIEDKRRPLLDLLLQTADDETVLTHNDIKEEISGFMFAGHDTTAASLSWFLYCMATNPQCQDRVFDELHDIFGASHRPCSFDDLSYMKYLEYCMKESLRLYSSAALYERKINKDMKLGQYLIPAGCNLNIMAYGLHRNPRIYPNPTEYNPERFFPDQCADRHPFAFIPFSAGPRNCIGQKFAMIEEKVILSTLIRRYKFQLSPLSPRPIPSFQGILKPMNGMHIVISKR